MNKQLKTLIKQTDKKPPQYRTEATWLPVFHGYYDSLFDPEDNFVEYETNMSLEEKKEHYPAVFNEGVTEDFFDEYFWECLTNRAAAMEAVSEYICEALKRIDPIGVIKAIEYESLSSPKFYNFSNDSINCKITFDQKILQEYINENIEAFTKFIEDRYTSRDGFSSFHSNDVEDWKNLDDLGEHSTGSVLEFVFINEYKDKANDPWVELYYESNVSEAFMSNIEFDSEKMIELFKSKTQICIGS